MIYGGGWRAWKYGNLGPFRNLLFENSRTSRWHFSVVPNLHVSSLSIMTDQTQGGALFFFIVDLGGHGNTDSLVLFTSYFSKSHGPHRWRVFSCSQIACFEFVNYNRQHRAESSFFLDVGVGRSGKYGNLGPLQKLLFENSRTSR